MALTPEELRDIASAVAAATGQAVKDAMSTVSGKSGYVNFNVADLKEFQKELDRSSEYLRRAQPGYKKFAEFLKGTESAIPDLESELREFQRAVKTTQEAIDENTDEEKRKLLNDKKTAAEETLNKNKSILVTRAVSGAFSNLALGVVKAGGIMLDGAWDFAKGLQANKSGNDLYTASMIGVVKTTSAFAQSITQLMETGGTIISVLGLLNPELRILGITAKWFGGIMASAGAALGFLSKSAGDIAEKALTSLNDQFNKLKDSIQLINSVGGSLSGGMAQLNYLASDIAKIDIKDFAEGIKAGKDSIFNTGLSFEAATTKVARAMGLIRNQQLGFGEQLDKLGYSISEQVDLETQVMARLQSAGKLRESSDEDIARQTVEYGKSLKILANITDGNAKEALRQAQIKAQEQGFIAVAARYGGDATEKLQAQIAIYSKLGDTANLAYMEYIQTGVIRDKAANLLFQTNEEFRNGLIGARQILEDSTKTQSDAAQQAASAARKAGDAQIEFAKTTQGQTLSQSAILGQNETVKGLYKAGNDLILARNHFDEQGLKEQKANVENQAKNQNAIDANNAKIIESQAKALASFNSKMLDPLEKFSTSMVTSAEYFGKLNEALESVISFVANNLPGNKKASATVLQNLPPPAPTVSNNLGGNGVSGAGNISGGAGGEGDFGAVLDAAGTGPAPTVAPTQNKGILGAIKNFLIGLSGTQTAEPTAAAAPSAPTYANGMIRFAGGATGNQENFEQLNANVKDNFLRMAQDYFQETHKPITITSAKRSVEDQERIYNAWKKAGGGPNNPTAGGYTLPTPPGTMDSHVLGRALDIDKNDYSVLNTKGILQKYFQVLPNDPGHIQLMDKGGTLDRGEYAIAGENGPEIVEGPKAVTSTSDTSQLFKSINDNLVKIHSVMLNQYASQQKMLRAVV